MKQVCEESHRKAQGRCCPWETRGSRVPTGTSLSSSMPVQKLETHELQVIFLLVHRGWEEGTGELCWDGDAESPCRGRTGVGTPAPAASRTRVPVGDTGLSADAWVTPALDAATESPEPCHTCVLESAGGLSLYIDHALVFLLEFYLTHSVALRNRLLSGRDNIYIPHKGFWTKFCFWLHVSIPPTNSNAAAMSNRAGFVLLRLQCHTSYFNSSKSPFPCFPRKIQCTFGKKQKGHLLSIENI